MALGLPVVLWTGYVQRVTRRAMTMTPTYTPGGTPSTTAHGTIATMALKAAPNVSWYKTARGGTYALGAFILIIAAFMAMRAFGIGPAATLLGTGSLKAKEPIIMTDFSVTNGDTSLARVVSFAVRTGLTLKPRVDVYGFSRGAQLAHRFAIFFPERVDHVVVFSAGTYTLPFGARTVPGNGGPDFKLTKTMRLGASQLSVAQIQNGRWVQLGDEVSVQR